MAPGLLVMQLLCWLSVACLGTLVDRSFRNYRKIIPRQQNTADLAESYGYPAEQHEVPTVDGFTLTLFRIPNPGKVPVLMQHGIYLNSDHWVLQGSQDLPFQLFERGYDVWMGNSRGTRYSSHKKYTINSFQFWKFSSDDVALKDLPVMIDYVLNQTTFSSLSYVGHSRGSSGPFMLLSEMPEYNNKIHMMQLLAPVLYTKYAECPIYYIASNRSTALMSTNTFMYLSRMTGIGRVLNFPPPVRIALKAVCSSGTALDHLCPFLYFFINGEDFINFNYTLTPKILDHFTEGMGTKEVNHLQQISSANRFQKFDYGATRNVKLYGRERPPEYNISAALVPTYLYYGGNDLFMSKKDHAKFTKQVSNLVSNYKVPYERFNHIDYFWGRNAKQVLFPKFLLDIQEFHYNKKFQN